MAGHALSPAARADVEESRDYTVRNWGEAPAERYTRDIRDACEALGDGTLSVRSAEDIRAGYRKAAVGSHVMSFRVRADVVEVVRILHRSVDVGRHIQRGYFKQAGFFVVRTQWRISRCLFVSFRGGTNRAGRQREGQ